MSEDIRCGNRFVIQYGKKVRNFWVPNETDVSEEGGKIFLVLRHTDRGLAKFLGASCNVSSPPPDYMRGLTMPSRRGNG